MSRLKSMIDELFHGTIHVDQLERRVREIVDNAWIDNAEPGKIFADDGRTRRHFDAPVSRFVLEYYAREGRFPEGYHHLLSGDRAIYFAPARRAIRFESLAAA